jgi:hypothetical protein
MYHYCIHFPDFPIVVIICSKENGNIQPNCQNDKILYQSSGANSHVWTIFFFVIPFFSVFSCSCSQSISNSSQFTNFWIPFRMCMHVSDPHITTNNNNDTLSWIHQLKFLHQKLLSFPNAQPWPVASCQIWPSSYNPPSNRILLWYYVGHSLLV